MSKLKYLIVLASGMADEPVPELADRTPVDAAHTPALDTLAHDGKIGIQNPIPDNLPASEEVALFSALGYDPHAHFSSEAALAAADIGLEPATGRIAVAHNLTTTADDMLVDHAAGHISQKEAEALLGSLSGALGRPDIEFHVGRGFAGVTIFPPDEDFAPVCVPPEQAFGSPLRKHMPHGKGGDVLCQLIELSAETFTEHDINRVRADLGENPANLWWPWGAGRLAALLPFEVLHGLRAAMVAAPGPARGLGRLSAMHVPDVEGATGAYRTDYAAKAQCALDLLERFDLVAVHVASPAEASLEGNVQRKVRAIEDIDAMITAPLLQRAREDDSVRVMFLATHVANVTTRSRMRGNSPLVLYGPGFDSIRHGSFSEGHAAKGEITVARGCELLEYFLRD